MIMPRDKVKPKQNPSKELIAQLDCPQCNEKLDIFKITDVKQKAVAAEKEVTFTVEKSTQTTLS